MPNIGPVEEPELLLSPESRAQGHLLIEFLKQMVGPLARALPAATEVVLHDLSRMPNSIVAIAGGVTGRAVGDPATDVLLLQLQSGEDTLVGYRTDLPNGREGRSTTMILRLASGEPVAAFCINADVTGWQAAGSLIGSLLAEGGQAPAPSVAASPAVGAVSGTRRERGEAFVRTVDELAATLIEQENTALGVPVELMKKQHKLQAVAGLEGRGMFMLRDAVDTVAAALNVTRYTIYNYLNEISAERAAASARSSNTGTEAH